jgi:hypothetical protein
MVSIQNQELEVLFVMGEYRDIQDGFAPLSSSAL